MQRLNFLRATIAVVFLSALSAICTTAAAAEMTFQFVNDTDRALNMKLFSRGESRQQWPAKTKAYSLQPDAAVQQLKIKCEEGEQICWGAWATVQSVSGELGSSGRTTRTHTFNAGVGERGLHDCPGCCHICKEGAVAPAASLRNSSAQSPAVR
ncbi:MAG: hypothetical protein WCL29_04655 [Pseudomonadota bacterium]